MILDIPFVITTVIFFSVVAEQVHIQCPKRCRCNMFEKLKMVQCVHLNLVNIVDVPNAVQFLDLSNNQIKELKDHEFIDMGLTSLKLLNLSHNKISDIKMHAFQNLKNIKTIDLSYNVIQYIHSEWFYDLGSLTELYMSNNDFATVPNDLIESKSLEVLDLSYCRIPHIKEMFSKLPNLQRLNLQGNSLIELNTNAINYLPDLQVIKLDGNPLQCENVVVKQLISYLNDREVGFHNPCQKPPRIAADKKLERMVQLENPVDDKNSWIYDDTDGESLNATIIYNCTQVHKDDMLMEIIKLSPILSLAIPFIVGLVLGLIIACSTQAEPPKVKPQPERTKRYSIIRSRMQLTEQDFPLVANCENLYESTPVPQRRFEFHQL